MANFHENYFRNFKVQNTQPAPRPTAKVQLTKKCTIQQLITSSITKTIIKVERMKRNKNEVNVIFPTELRTNESVCF